MGIMGDINQIGIITPDIERSIEQFKKIGLESWSEIFENTPDKFEDINIEQETKDFYKKYYGFELEAKNQLIPQRYMLVFRMVDKRVEKAKLKSRVKYNLRTLGERFKAKPQRPQ